MVAFNLSITIRARRNCGLLEGEDFVLDCYIGYQVLVDSGQDDCWEHDRTKFFAIFTANKSLVAKLALDTNRELCSLSA